MTDFLALDATDQLAALSDRQISARELLDLSVQRADELHKRLNAVVVRDLPRAVAEAQAIDDRRARGESLGPLAGLPMTIKDHFDIDGFPSSFGGDARLLKREATDCGIARKIRAAGAVVWGRTNLSFHGGDVQSFNRLYGATNNPWDVSRTCGGSSGGSAVALALGMTALEIGSDIGGSLRTPASFCGIYSHKPTSGLISQRGFAPAAERIVADMDLAVIGPMARSARDLRLLLSLLAEREMAATAPPANLNRLRIGLWLNEPSFTLDAECRAPLESCVAALVSAGAKIEPASSPVPARDMMFAYTWLLYGVLGAQWPRAALAALEMVRPAAKLALACGARPLSQAQSVVGLTARHREWLAANETRARMAEKVQAFFETYDVLIAPVFPVAAFPHDHSPLPLRKLKLSDGRAISYMEMLNWIALATLFGLPATVVPAGLTKGGLPVGLQIIGPHGGDELTLAVAQAIEERLGGFRWPPVVTSAGKHAS